MKNSYKKIISVVLTIIILLTAAPMSGFEWLFLDIKSFALDSYGNCGNNVKWHYNGSTGELVISGSGNMEDYSINSPFRDSNIKTVVINSGVTSIGDYAFYDCTALTRVTIPDSVTSIGNYAFNNCKALRSITIPDFVTNIGTRAFYDCAVLANVTMSNGVTFIGSGAFGNCKALKSMTIPDGVMSIEESTFRFCTSLSSITIPDSIINIGSYAFIGCSSLIYITIPQSVTSIGFQALDNTGFYNDSSNWTDGELYINDNLVRADSSRTGEYIIKPGTKYIAGGAFSYLNGITRVSIPDSVISIGNSAFFDCRALIEITIPDGVTSISDGSFGYCRNLTSVTLPDSITSIGVSAFANCTGLTNIIIPESVASIGNYAFADCTGLTNVIIPDIVSYIGLDSFRGVYRIEYYGTANASYCGARIINHIDSDDDGFCDECGKGLSDILPGKREAIKTSAGQIGYLRFVPEQSGVYNFYSDEDFDFNNYDYFAYGYICRNDKTIIASDTSGSYNGGNFSVSATLTAGNVYYLGTRFSDETCSGFITVYLDLIQAICDHTSTHIEHKDASCTESGYHRVICDICGETLSEEVYPITHNFVWETVINPTTTHEGLARKRCLKCEYVAEEFTMPRLLSDFVTGITISPKTIALNVGETADIVTVITPDTATNKNIIWSSTDSENAAVSGGTVTAVRPGTSVIIAETEDGGYRDFCQVRVISLTASNGAVVNSENGLVYGLAPKLGSIDGYIDTVDDSISAVCEDSVIGTGSVIQIVRDGELIDSYKAVIFGDVNSDGVYDGQDAFIVNCIANGMLTREQVGEAKFLAADCNHDGEVNSSDVLILEQAGLLLSKVEQAKDEEMKEQSLGEYLDLIDQNPEKENTSSAENSAIISIFKYVVNLIKKCFDYIISTFFPKV